MKRSHETGRSMIELLGVLCVVGVIIVGGAEGYSWGMNKYRDNKIIDGLRHRMLLAGLGRRSGQMALNQKGQIEESLMGYPVTLDVSYTDADLEVEDAKKITLSGMDQKVCRFIKSDSNLVTLSQEANTIVLVNGVRLDQSPTCSDTNDNDLAVIMVPPAALENPLEDSTEYCSYWGSLYRSGQSVNQCGVCNKGTVMADPTKGTVCQICNTSDWSLIPIEDGKMKQQDGRCCVKGELTYHNSFCPEPAATCTFGEQVYPNGSDVGACGICNTGKIEVNSAKYNAECQICNQTNYMIENKTGTCDYNGGTGNGLCAKGQCISCSGWIDANGVCCPDDPSCSEDCQTNDDCIGDRVCVNNHCGCPDNNFEATDGKCYSCSDLYHREATPAECAKCGSERFVFVEGTKTYCDWVCPNMWFRNDNRNCTHCGFDSPRATSEEECKKCTGDLARTWNPSTRMCALPDSCPTEYFKGSDSICRSCSDESAYPATKTECDKCNDKRMMVGSTCALAGSCPDDYFWVSGTKSCLSCSDTYAAKTDEASCNACGGSRWYGKKNGIGQAGYCEPVCPTGWFQNANGNCTDCANASGKATTEAQCALCQTTAFEREFKQDGKCYLKNPPTSGYFKDDTGVYRSCSDPKSYKPSPSTECNKCGELRGMVSGYCVLK